MTRMKGPLVAALLAAPTPACAQSASDALVARILARPLFAPDRRPAPPAAGPAGGSQPTLPRLSGVLVSSTDRFAIFAAVDGKLLVAREGGPAGPFLVMRIAPDEVTVLGPGGRQALHPRFSAALADAKSVAKVAGAAAAAPATTAAPLAAPAGGPSILDQLQTGGAGAVPLPPPLTLQGMLGHTRQ
jgi:general secretion pathway protein N